ncbi:hypothetical protein M569_00411 [Genlisea aurea]|uniref:RNA-binding S4 domain-containing protein n=1 Tax=Genlisea aurea TaxID=192259 RepID=S8D3S3_9LAMI|nr:hypothetical protein M569_00411 [Genlisea aurea]
MLTSLQGRCWRSAKPRRVISRRNLCLLKFVTVACPRSNSLQNATSDSDSDDCAFSGQSAGHSRLRIEEAVCLESEKVRLDSWISSRIGGISRARVQSSIRSGFVSVNGSVVNKVSYLVRHGDVVNCSVPELRPLRAEPEDIPLDIVHEDEHILVLNKPPHMVVHPAPGNANGTLVNGILGHCQLPPSSSFSPDVEIEEDSSDGSCIDSLDHHTGGRFFAADVRPGIVHRLDKGTSGLLVVAKDEYSHSHLAEQFQKHTVKRLYMSISCGVPSPSTGCIDVPIGRDPNNRIRMVGIPGSSSRGKARHAVSSAARAHSGAYSELLSNLSKIGASLSQIRQAHAQLLRTGLFELSQYSNNILSLYARHQYLSDAKRLLRSLLTPDSAAFTVLITACSKSSDLKSTLILVSEFLRSGLTPDVYVLPSIIRACAGLFAFKIGKQAHGFSIVSGFVLDPFIESSLVHFYLKCGELAGARKVFYSMDEKDIVSWSALSAAYARKGDVLNAKKLFFSVRGFGFEPNAVSWNGMIAGFNQSKHFLDAVLMFQQMHSCGFPSDGINISSALPAVSDLGSLKLGTQVHGHVIKIGFAGDKCIVSALIDMYGKLGNASEILLVFEDMHQLDVVVCNALISGLSRHGLVDESLSMFEKLRSSGIENLVSWTSAISCCSQHGRDMEALGLFREMQFSGVKPNAVTIPSLLPACGNIAALSYGKAVHCFSLRNNICNDVYVGSALIDMYANCGKIKAARCLFERMPVRNLVCWNAMLGAYSMHGEAKEAIGLFQSMQRCGQKPDSVSFTSLLSACSQSGLAEEGRRYFESMFEDHGLEPRLEHYACIVGLLGRAGKLDEAYAKIKRMPFEADACVWGALLSSCALHNNEFLGEVAAEKLFELELGNSGNYILLSNIYASSRKWKEVRRIRDMMSLKGMKKNPGCSWIEVKNKVHMILAGDKALPQVSKIMERLKRLNQEMKGAGGYFPNTNYVLQDVEEQEEREGILCGHSEKLAVVFGILNTSRGSPIRVTKNLRICGDCHAVIKFISGFEGREISVRDTNRYHHFKDGICSCGDYW